MHSLPAMVATLGPLGPTNGLDEILSQSIVQKAEKSRRLGTRPQKKEKKQHDHTRDGNSGNGSGFGNDF
jgi:hypothetical protein